MRARQEPVRELRRETLFTGRIFEVARCELRLGNGRRARQDLVVHQGAAVLAPITDRGGVVLVRQWRHAAKGFLWEIPAGRLERGEAPLAAARRELAEECGLEARRWKKVAAFYPAPGYATEVMHLFVARGLRPARTEAHPDEDEDLEVREFSRAELKRAIASGRIVDGKTLVAALYLRLAD